MNQPEVSKDEIFKRLRDLLVEGFELRDEQIVPTARLIDDLELDSLDLVDFAVRLEQQVDLEIAEDELKGIKTVQDIVDLAYQKLNTARPCSRACARRRRRARLPAARLRGIARPRAPCPRAGRRHRPARACGVRRRALRRAGPRPGEGW